MATPNEADLRAECCRIGRALAANDWAPGSSGNLSARLDARQFLITPSGAALGELQPDDLLVLPFCDQQSEISTSGPRPSSELPMHRESYRQRPALKAVIHAHPPYTVALSIIGYDFRRAVVPETILTLGEVGVAPYALPASEENALAIRELAPQHEAIVLARHGTLTLGDSLRQALWRLEALEGAAKIIHLAQQLGEVKDLPVAEIARLRHHRQTLQGH